MTRLLAVLALVLALAACGGDAPAAADGGGGAPAGGGGAGGSDLPAPSQVLFGTAYDPSSLAVAGRAKSFKVGTPIVAVARTLAPHASADVRVRVTTRAQGPDPFPVTAAANPDNTDLFAADLSGLNLTAGTWTVAFVTAAGRDLASSDVQITP